MVAVPSPLKPEFEAITSAFRARHADVNVSLVGATPAQVAQDSLPVDLIAADALDALQPLASRLSPGERRHFASNPICLVVRPGAPELRLSSVASSWVQKVAIADGRSDSTGAATEAALGRLGIRRPIDPRLLYTASEQDSLEKLSRGEVDAAFALATDVAAWNARDGAARLQIADRYLDDPDARRRSRCSPERGGWPPRARSSTKCSTAKARRCSPRRGCSRPACRASN
jgi:ABC-type molybdate transport system substrate-binding protein